jgi:hypothetical protein
MKMRGLSFAVALASLGVARVCHATPIGILTNQIFNSSNEAAGATSLNDSSITVPTNDLIFGQLPVYTNYVGNYNASGGTLAVLTDGQTASSPSNFGNAAINPNEGSNSSNCAFDLGTDWYAEYNLGAPTAIGSIIVTTGHGDNRVNQSYDILVSDDGVHFTSLSDDSSQALGAAGTGFSYNPSGPPNYSGGAAQSTVVSANSSPTLAVAQYVEFVETSGGNDIYRELDVMAPVPEPMSLGFLSLGAIGLLARRRPA